MLETELLDAVVLGDEGLVAALLVSLTFVVDRRTVVPSYRRAVCRGDQLVALRSSAKKGRLLETPRPVAISRTNMSYCLLSSTSMANVMLLRKIRRSLPLTYALSPMSTRSLFFPFPRYLSTSLLRHSNIRSKTESLRTRRTLRVSSSAVRVFQRYFYLLS